MTYELNIRELDLVSGGDLKEVHFRLDDKEPTVLYDDGINIRTTGLFHSNVGYDFNCSRRSRRKRMAGDFLQIVVPPVVLLK